MYILAHSTYNVYNIQKDKLASQPVVYNVLGQIEEDLMKN